jgi:signal transduction histidine kinase
MTSVPVPSDQRPRPVAVPSWLVDGAVVLPPLGLGLLATLLRAGEPTGAGRVLAAGLVVVMSGALLVRRRFPIPVFAVVAACLLLQWSLSFPLSPADLCLFVALYAAAAYAGGIWPVAALATSLLGAVLAWWGGPRGAPTHPLLGLLAPTVAVVAIWLIGRNARTRRLYLVELEERARRLEREQHAEARAAVAEERARIAREMHDVVAHRVGVMVAQADGASYAFDTRPDQVKAAVEVIAENGRAALAELRHLLSVLRTAEQMQTRPQPGLDDIDELVSQMQAAGLPVRCEISRAAGPGEGAHEPQDLAAYRIVQESLTNVLKHAGPGTPAFVRIRRDAGRYEVEIVDSGSAAPRAEAGSEGAGHGLIGMRERAQSLGGTFVAGPSGARGWAVRATWPAEGDNAGAR